MTRVYHRSSSNYTSKICIGCRQDKPLNEFYKCASGRSYQVRCIPCYNKANAEREKQKRAAARLKRLQEKQARAEEVRQKRLQKQQAREQIHQKRIQEKQLRAEETQQKCFQKKQAREQVRQKHLQEKQASHSACSAATQMTLFPVYSIYALIDPVDESVRYIGMSAQPEIRLAYHLAGSFGRKLHWIQDLRSQGLLPVLEILETTDSKQYAYDREGYWIHYYAKRHAPLLNRSQFLYKKKA